MSQQLYRKLIDDVCSMAGIAEPADLYEMAALRVGDISFVMMPVTQTDEAWAIFFVDYGLAPKGRRELALERLLQANALAPDPFLPKFGIDSQTGHVLLTGYFQVGAISAESLIGLLHHHADQAREWRDTHFMTDEDSEQKERVSSADDSATRAGDGGHPLSMQGF